MTEDQDKQLAWLIGFTQGFGAVAGVLTDLHRILEKTCGIEKKENPKSWKEFVDKLSATQAAIKRESENKQTKRKGSDVLHILERLVGNSFVPERIYWDDTKWILADFHYRVKENPDDHYRIRKLVRGDRVISKSWDSWEVIADSKETEQEV